MKRKKQGASLIVVIILFMFVSTVSMAMLSMIAGNYKARVAESKRVENLYASDSGLDVAYNIIGKTFDAATKYGYYEVEALKNGNTKSPNNARYQDLKTDIAALNSDITGLNTGITSLKNETPTVERTQSDIDTDIAEKKRLIAQKKSLIEEDENMKQLLLNEEFKRTFKNFIAQPSTSTPRTNEAAPAELGTDEVVPNKLKESIDANEYVSETNFVNNQKTINYDGENTDFDKETIDFQIKNKDDESPTLNAEEIGNPIKVSGSLDMQKKIMESSGGHHKTVEFTVYGDQEYDITVTSTFYTQTVNTTRTNERQIKSNFKISVPNYKDIYFENANVHEYLATKDRALTIYGDMNVNNTNGSTGLTVDGEIFVNGRDDHSATNRAYGKYFGGITLNNSKVSFNNNVITRGTFNIQDTTNATFEENLYARNVFVGKTDSNQLANGPSTLDVSKGSVITDNDLALNANSTTITIKDFYGINSNNINTVNNEKSSSSIIVNGNSESKIDIKNSAYIMGIAHIDTAPDYKTAESGAIKGNYIAYSVSLNEAEKIIPYPPLQLLEPEEGKPDPLDPLDLNPTAEKVKENHFIKYWSQDGKNPNAGGIIWPHNEDGTIIGNNIWSSGIIVHETSESTVINGKTQNKCEVIPSHYYADLELPNGTNNVIYKKKAEFASKVYKFNQFATKEDDYDKTILTDFSSLINTGNIPSDYDVTAQTGKEEYAIFNGDVTKEIQIKKTTNTNDTISSSGNTIVIYVGDKGSAGHTLNAVIATAGNISIEDDDITINGCIIAEGDLNINNKNNITIKYDSGVIERVQVQNGDTFKAVFGESLVDDTNNIHVSPPGVNDAKYDLKNFLENKLWKILK